LWILPSELEIVIDFCTSSINGLLDAPIFTPEYNKVGISRELISSFNAIIAATLYRYLYMDSSPNLNRYIYFLENEKHNTQEDSSENFFKYYKFDREVILYSLKCIQQAKCPVHDSRYNFLKIKKS
jgi:hypothetical protein